MTFIKLPDTSIEVSPLLVKQGVFGLSPPGLTRTNVSVVEADEYAASVGCRLLTSDEWDKLLIADLPEVSIGDLGEWTSTTIGTDRVNRGGGQGNNATNTRVANRYGVDPGYTSDDIGFRLVRDL